MAEEEEEEEEDDGALLKRQRDSVLETGSGSPRRIGNRVSRGSTRKVKAIAGKQRKVAVSSKNRLSSKWNARIVSHRYSLGPVPRRASRVFLSVLLGVAWQTAYESCPEPSDTSSALPFIAIPSVKL